MVETKEKKNIVLVLVIGIIIVGLLILSFVAFHHIYEYSKNISKYKQRASEYLHDQYNRDFKLKFNSKGYKMNFGSGVFSGLNIGHNRNMEEYVFKVYDEDIDDNLYITL